MSAEPNQLEAVFASDRAVDLAAALDACPAGVLVTDSAGTVLWLNAVAASWTGLAAPIAEPVDWDALGLPWHYSPELWRAICAGRPKSLAAHAWQRGDGATVSLQASLDLLRTAPGAESRIVCYLSSVELRSFAADAGLAGSFEWWPQHGRMLVHHAWLEARSLDVPPDCGTESEWRRALHPDDLPALDSALATTRGGANEFECEYRVARKDHSWLWVLHRGRVVERAADGGPLALVGLLVDVDARKREESQVRSNETRLATALWGARAAFWQWHAPTNLGTQSPLWFAMTGYSRAEWESEPHPWEARLHRDDRERVLRQLADHQQGRRDSVDYEYRIKTASGEWKWMLDRGRAVEWDLDGKPTLVIGVSLDIDAAKQAETALRSSESRLQTAVWGAGIGLWETDFRAEHTRWFNDWCDKHDIDPCAGPDHVARWDDNLHPEDAQRAIAKFSAHVAGLADHYDAEYRIRTRGGVWRWVFERGRVVERTPAGVALRMVGICMDVDERMAAEVALREQNKRLEAALDVTHGGSWDWNIRDDIAHHSDAYYRLFGVEPEVGRADKDFWQSRVHPADEPAPLENLRRKLASGHDYHEAEYRIRHASGEWRWVLDRGRVIERDAEQRPTRMVGLLVDITDRKTRELTLQASEQRFRTAAAAVRGIVYEVDLATRYTMREGVERVLGYQPHEVAADADSWFELYHPDDRARAKKLYGEYLARGVSEGFTCRVRHRDGHYVSLWESPLLIRDIAGKPIRSIGFAIDVTEQVTRQAQLADSEQMFRTVAALAPGFVWQLRYLDAQRSEVARVSGGFENLMGCTLAEFERAGGWPAFVADDSRAAAAELDRSLRAGELADETEIRIRRLDESERWLLVRGQSVRDSTTGRVTGAIGSAEDVTTRREAEDALRRSQAQLMTIAQSSADWLVLLDAECNVLFINRAMVGRQPPEIVGKKIGEVVQPGTSEYITGLARQVLATGEPIDVEQDYMDPVKGRRVFDMRIRPVRAGERVAGVVMNATEITGRREADQLRATQSRMLETLREAVAVVAADGTIRLTNASFDRLFGFAAGGAVGSALTERLQTRASDTNNHFDRLMRQAAAQPVATSIEFECTRCDGEAFTASCATAQIQLDDGAHWLVTFTDVTERKRMEREILEIASREQLRIGSDLHDGLGQDLTGIALMLRSVAVQLRKEDSGVRGEVEDVIALVNSAIESTRAMARGLSPVGADRGGLIAGLQAMAARGIERYGVRTQLTTRLREPLQLDDARAGHLYRIAQEALTNAIRHGRVSEVGIELETGDEQLTLSVTDNGRGLASTERAGDGMGLKLMRYRAQMVEGALTVANRPQGGVVVRCTCPHRVDGAPKRTGGFPLKD